MADDQIALGKDLQIASYGEIPGTDQTQFMINAGFGGGLFEALTLTVLIPNEIDESAQEAAAIARAKQLAEAFSRQAEAGEPTIALTVEAADAVGAAVAAADNDDDTEAVSPVSLA